MDANGRGDLLLDALGDPTRRRIVERLGQGPAGVQELADELVEDEIPAIFVESSVPRRNVEAVQAAAEDQGWEVTVPEQELYADAMGEPGTEAGTYAGMLRANADTISEALTRDAEQEQR